MATLSADELEELYGVVAERIIESLLPALTTANRTGDLKKLLELLCMGDLIAQEGELVFSPERILVVGETLVNEGELRSLVRKQGFDPNSFEFALGYDELKHFNFDKLRNTFTYKAVMAGPMPHSVPGKRDASSIITQMENHPENYPPVIRLGDANGLKITRSSFLKGLEEFC